MHTPIHTHTYTCMHLYNALAHMQSHTFAQHTYMHTHALTHMYNALTHIYLQTHTHLNTYAHTFSKVRSEYQDACSRTRSVFGSGSVSRMRG